MNQQCAALIETKMVGDEQEARVMLDSHQVPHVSEFKVKIVVGARKVWTTSVVIHDTGAGPNLIREVFFMTA